jgi:hypothetical protein
VNTFLQKQIPLGPLNQRGPFTRFGKDKVMVPGSLFGINS